MEEQMESHAIVAEQLPLEGTQPEPDNEVKKTLHEVGEFFMNLSPEHHKMSTVMDLFYSKTGLKPTRFEESVNKFTVKGLSARQLQQIVVSQLGSTIKGFGRSDFKNYIEVDLAELDGTGYLDKYCFDVNDKRVAYYD